MSSFNTMQGQNQRQCICFVQFARWRHWGRGLPSQSASFCNVILPSALWHCWLNDTKGIRPSTNLLQFPTQVLFWGLSPTWNNSWQESWLNKPEDWLWLLSTNADSFATIINQGQGVTLTSDLQHLTRTSVWASG